MAVPETIQQAVIGHILEITVKKTSATGAVSVRDISGGTTLEILAKPPSGTAKTLTAALTTDGTDGKLDFTTVSGTIDESGIWEIQGKITEGASPITYTSIGKLKVIANLA